MINVQDLDAELGWVSGVLATAKEQLEEGGELTPTGFMRRPDGGLVVCPVVGDWDDVGDELHAMLLKLAREHGATEWAFSTDSFAMSCLDPEAQKALVTGDGRAWRSWSPEYKRRVGFERGEAILVSVERAGRPRFMVLQFYTRGREGAITWGRCLAEDQPTARGETFGGILPGTAPPAADGGGPEDVWQQVAAAIVFGFRIGHTVAVEGDEIVWRRPNGETYQRLQPRPAEGVGSRRRLVDTHARRRVDRSWARTKEVRNQRGDHQCRVSVVSGRGPFTSPTGWPS